MGGKPWSLERHRAAFLQKVDRSGGADACWPWLGAGKGNGYGNVRLGKKNVSAHRRGYELFVGEMPDDHDARHTCDHRWCANWNHVEPGTRTENVADARDRGRLTGHYRRDTREAAIQEQQRRQFAAAAKERAATC